MSNWSPGFTRAELEAAQDRYDVRFPSDLQGLLEERRPADGYDWASEDGAIRRMLGWPQEILQFDVDHGAWWSVRGERPADPAACREVVRDALARAPRLIPILSHRYIPETPCEAGNPVFSMYGFDTIYYGADLDEYFTNEFGRGRRIGPVRRIPFWSDMVDAGGEPYATSVTVSAANDALRGAIRKTIGDRPLTVDDLRLD